MSLLGRAIAITGIVSGLLAIGLPFASGSRYVDDGTTLAFLLVLLSFASWLPAEIGRDALGAAGGAATFGFFLFVPALASFDHLGDLGAGAWLGLCTALIPIGAFVSWAGRRGSGEPAPARRFARPLGLPLAFAGLVLAVVGIWLDAASEAGSYWNLSSSGHAVGILMLLLVVLNAGLLAAPTFAPSANVGNLDLLVAAATFGFVEVGVISTAFGNFGSLGAGGWLEGCAGALLLIGVVKLRGAAAPAAASAQ